MPNPNPEESGVYHRTPTPQDEAHDRRSGIDRREDSQERLDHHDRRLLKLERLVSESDKNIAVTSATVKGLSTTMDARLQAITSGIETIASGQRHTERSVADIAASVALCTNRITEIEGLRQRGEGALWIVRLLGLSAVVSFFLWVVRNWKG